MTRREISALTTREAARIIGVSPSTICSHCASGRIKASRVPPFYRTWDIPESEVKRLQQERAHGARKTPTQHTQPPVYQQMIELGKRTTMARLCYAIRRLCALLDDDHWQQHVAYVAQREADRRRTGE